LQQQQQQQQQQRRPAKKREKLASQQYNQPNFVGSSLIVFFVISEMNSNFTSEAGKSTFHTNLKLSVENEQLIKQNELN